LHIEHVLTITIAIADDRLLNSGGASAACADQLHLHNGLKGRVLAISIDNDRLPEFADNCWRIRISRQVLSNRMCTNDIR
jgi:hypothetical protein